MNKKDKEYVGVLSFDATLKYLGISQRTFYNNYRFFIKGVREGKSVYFPIEELDRRTAELNEKPDVIKKKYKVMDDEIL